MEKYEKSYFAPLQKIQNSASLNKEGELKTVSDRD